MVCSRKKGVNQRNTFQSESFAQHHVRSAGQLQDDMEFSRMERPQYPFQCFDCNRLTQESRWYMSKEALMQHKAVSHRPSSVSGMANAPEVAKRQQCFHCEATFLSEAELYRHKDSKHPSLAYGGRGVNPRPSESRAVMHTESCKLCGDDFQNTEALNLHTNSVHEKCALLFNSGVCDLMY